MGTQLVRTKTATGYRYTPAAPPPPRQRSAEETAEALKRTPASMALVTELATGLADQVRELRAEVVDLRERLAEAEEHAKSLRYCGPYEPGRSYSPGNFASWNGSMWACTHPTTSRPGDSDCWTLAVKRGADAR